MSVFSGVFPAADAAGIHPLPHTRSPVRLSVIGCGYLGAVHAAAMASIGHDVVGIDVDQRKVEALAQGVAPFFEPGLPELLRDGVAAGSLRFTTGMSAAADATVHFI